MHSLLIAAFAFAVSFGLSGWALRRAIAVGLMDVPNERSSHAVPTPRGAGVGIVLGVEFVLLVRLAGGGALTHFELSLLVAGALVALVGYLDDRYGLSAAARLAVHLVAAGFVIAALPLPSVPLPGGVIALGVVGRCFALLAILWSINLFNFMDGIDGLAGSQAVFVFGAAALLNRWFGGHVDESVFLFAAAAAALGFLAWNWPPARIFMGDVGSGFLGLLVAVTALGSSGAGPLTVWTWVVLHAIFVGDATVTVLVRMWRAERLSAAHRTHLYQRLSRCWGSHRKVVIVSQGYNFAILLPLSVLTVRNPGSGAVIAILALAPVVASALWFGAGKPGDIEGPSHI